MKVLLIALFVMIGSAYAQTKKDLQDKIDVQSRTIDSLIKIIDNHANIIENRDRSVKLAREHRDEMKVERDDARRDANAVRQENERLLRQTIVGDAQLMTFSTKRAILKAGEG